MREGGRRAKERMEKAMTEDTEGKARGMDLVRQGRGCRGTDGRSKTRG